MSPGFGEDDQRVCAENGIDVVVPVDEKGRYTDEIFDLGALTHNDDGSFESRRCILRAPTQADEADFIALHTDAKVMETMNDGPMSVDEAKADFAANMAHFAEHGYGQWVITHKESGKFMGRAGLTFVAQSAEVEAMPTLRCGLLADYWHGGYGSELCEASLRWGFTEGGFDLLAAGALANNPRAHEMLKRLGLNHLKDVQYKRIEGPYFQISKDEFLAKHPSLSLKSLNVIAQKQGACEGEPYNDDQLAKYGLANLRIINWLKMTCSLVKQDDYNHNYPHCWRTDEPLIYRAMPSWYVEVTKIRDRAVESIISVLNQPRVWPTYSVIKSAGKCVSNHSLFSNG